MRSSGGWVRIIPDDETVIIETVQHCSQKYDFVLTTGGIGPTHDDITSACIAKAFNIALIRNPEAEARLKKQYKPEELNAARLKMADIPEGADLIDNPVSAAPGFIVENVFVLAGIPSIMQAMFHTITHHFSGGTKMLSHTLTIFEREGNIAGLLGDIQAAHTSVDIGSYPFIKDERLGASIVVRTTDRAQLDKAVAALKQALSGLTDEIIEESM